MARPESLERSAWRDLTVRRSSVDLSRDVELGSVIVVNSPKPSAAYVDDRLYDASKRHLGDVCDDSGRTPVVMAQLDPSWKYNVEEDREDDFEGDGEEGGGEEDEEVEFVDKEVIDITIMDDPMVMDNGYWAMSKDSQDFVEGLSQQTTL
ncbi:hypothetical protein Syun_011879 [Stephania yunnanensis]|uniref:Uncharacterized protein n=1 Tax=Stephania yunnanensis TaxID=152371 RepID=A0AAP0PGY4_9MAGN